MKHQTQMDLNGITRAEAACVAALIHGTRLKFVDRAPDGYYRVVAMVTRDLTHQKPDGRVRLKCYERKFSRPTIDKLVARRALQVVQMDEQGRVQIAASAEMVHACMALHGIRLKRPGG
ncbi:hypothetical protein CcrMagneto_gp317 [Caulobacter virus Magneto]|uniref:hypothetical protein n=1 Tax=Caulobacter virus Magneto TaxID=1211642 RepID=UPI00028A89E5|nr:hypothetical protein CcrMagneto_gp317 [Caulobacter virus Magneto]AFU87487.1 hypothetical protein CcrMagneto_gp317 [Caulobacter virus Magneto]